MDLKITENTSEMIEIGRSIVQLKPNIYTPPMIETIRETIREFNSGPRGGIKDLTEEELFYKSVYDYWVYGNSCDEEFYYEFINKSHAQKQEYMTFRMREKYCQHLNSREDRQLFVDKYKTYQFFKKFFLRDVIQIRGDDDYDTFLEFVKKHPSFVVKPRDGAFGVGVYLVKETDYTDYRELFDSIRMSGQKTRDEVVWAKNDAVVLEEVIEQVEEMAQFHPWSVNGVRVTTVKVNGKVHIYHPWFKIGADRHFVTSAVFGTLDAVINPETGVVETKGYKENGESFDVHPNTGIPISGYQIPKWKELTDAATEAAMMLENTNYVGWDFVLTPKGWCMMEANYDGDFMWQLCYDKGMKKEFEELIGWEYDKQFWWE